jgi:hypothetical protein
MEPVFLLFCSSLEQLSESIHIGSAIGVRRLLESRVHRIISEGTNGEWGKYFWWGRVRATLTFLP